MRRSLFHISFLATALMALLLNACRTTQDDPMLRAKVEMLSRDIETLREELDTRVEADTLEREPTFVLLSPGDPKPAYVKIRGGYLAVRIDSLQPDAGGCKVTFHFGNPNNVTLKGLSAQLEWITLGGDGPGSLETRAPVRYEFMRELKPGSLTPMPVLLLETAPASVRGVRLSAVEFQDMVFATADTRPKRR